MMQRMRVVAAALVGLAMIAAAPIRLESNRVTYKVSLANALPGGVAAVHGSIVSEFRVTCTGYDTAQRFVSDTTDAQNSTSRSDFMVKSWESRSGDAMRFEMLDLVNGQPVEQYKGRATHGRDGAGTVALTEPKNAQFDLPKGTLFPTMQTLGVLSAAEAGKRSFNRVVFQGGGQDYLYDTTTTIGAEVPRSVTDRAAAAAGAMLRGVRAWPVLMGYYTRGTDGEAPEYEIAARLYANGVVGSMEMIYPRFTLKATLEKVEKLPSPAC